MFEKLRTKFLSLHIIITSLVMIAAFSIVYLATFSNMQADIQRKLESLVGSKSFRYIGSEQGAKDGGPVGDKARGSVVTTVVTAGDSLSFIIEVNEQGQILNIQSFIDLPETAYAKAADIAWNDREKRSAIRLEGYRWQYIVAPVKSQTVVENDRGTVVSVDETYQIAFLDVTDSRHTLRNLLVTFLLVGVVMLAVILIVSRYLADRAIEPIAAAWEKQRQFVADASHELKTPLSIINANYDALMANKEETIQSQTKWLNYMKIGTDRMTKLINDLLSLAKTEDANDAASKTPFEINTVIEEVLLSMETAVQHKGLTVSSVIEPEIIMNSDPELVKQLFSILYDNAVKYTDADGRIEIKLQKQKNRILCTVKNTGEGIPIQDLPKIFDRFYRADPSRSSATSGYGLGLSIARNIVNRLGGEITVASVRNEWTTFTIMLPMTSPKKDMDK